jgi:putative addiction module component (TIGR02574 family)
MGHILQTINCVFWEEDGTWLGYLQDYPDYWTQGETLKDLEEHLRDLYSDLTSGPTLTDAHKQDLERRLAAHESYPKSGSSWEEVKARLRKKDIADG